MEILQDTAGEAMKRDNNLSHLTEISLNLENNADEFKRQAIGVKKQQWWKHMKTRLVFAGLFAFFLIILICAIFL